MDAERWKARLRRRKTVHQSQFVDGDWLIWNEVCSDRQTPHDPKKERERSRELTFRGLKGGTAEEFTSRASTRGPASGTRRSEVEGLLCTR